MSELERMKDFARQLVVAEIKFKEANKELYSLALQISKCFKFGQLPSGSISHVEEPISDPYKVKELLKNLIFKTEIEDEFK